MLRVAAMKQNGYPRRRPRDVLLGLLVWNWRYSSGFQASHTARRHQINAMALKPQQFASDTSESDDEFISSVLYEGTFEGMDNGVLAYLRDGGKTMPPKTRRLISQITSEYVYGVEGRPNLDSRGVTEVFDSEYEPLPVSVVVGSKTFGPGQGEELVVQIASLGVLYGLPAEILLKILDCAEPNNQTLKEFRTEFEAVGWEQVSFPSGLGIRVKKDLVFRTSRPSSDQSFFPPSRIPWKSRSSRRASEAAQRGIELAAKAVAPEQNFMTKEEFLVEIENEIQADPLSQVAETESTTSFSSGSLALGGDVLPSFPSQRYGMAWKRVKRLLISPTLPFADNATWKKFSGIWVTQIQRMKDAGRAGLMAYAFINFVLYTVGVTWQWRHIAVEAPSGNGATLVSLVARKFVKVFARVYLAAGVFKLVRIAASLAIAPSADRVLRFTQRKLRVSENAAFLLLLTLLLKTFFGTLAVVCLGDSALRQALKNPLEAATV